MSDAEIGEVVRNWWSIWINNRDSGAARAFAARARRSSDIDLLCEPASHELAKKLQMGTGDAQRLLRITRVLAELRDSHAQPLARKLGGDPPVLSPARFKRLMRSDAAELTTGLVRAVRMLSPASRSCNISGLAKDLFYWNDQTRTRWTFDYYGTTPPKALTQADATENIE